MLPTVVRNYGSLDHTQQARTATLASWHGPHGNQDEKVLSERMIGWPRRDCVSKVTQFRLKDQTDADKTRDETLSGNCAFAWPLAVCAKETDLEVLMSDGMGMDGAKGVTVRAGHVDACARGDCGCVLRPT
jgi:hypothetical protein